MPGSPTDRVGSYRLVGATVWSPSGPQTYGYSFADKDVSCGSGSGVAQLAGRNSNRSAKTGPSGSVTYCYDQADRLVSTSDTGVGAVGYDTRGNMTTVGGETHSYDVADRHVSTVKGSTTVSYSRDVTDRIIQRVASGETTVRYNYLGSGDAADFVTTTGGALVEASYTLPGGVLLTWRTGGGSVWSYTNLQGTIAAVANQAGVKQGGTFGYDPDGNTFGTPVDNAAGKFDYGWHGEAQRPVETAAGLLPMIEMGARQYLPRLGRFIEIDSVEGGSANDYSYVIDPINGSDLDGMCGWTDPWGRVKKVARRATRIAKSTAKAVGRRVRTNGLGKHWRGALQVVTVVASAGCVAATAGTEAAACLYAGAALAAASTAQSYYDNIHKRKRKCWANCAKDTVLNIATAALPFGRVTGKAANIIGMTILQNTFNAGATTSAVGLGKMSYCK